MRLSKLFLTASAAAIGVTGLALPALAQVDELVVTAQRREESLQTVPVAVTAFGEVQLDQRQINSSIDLIRNTPGLIGENNLGQGGAVVLFMRGDGSDEALVQFEPPVSTYLDDVIVPRQITQNVDFLDIERIEVLRGPQGTLYGKNTTGGAIKIITRKPSDEFEAKLSARYGNYDSIDVNGYVNVPVTDNLFVKLTAGFHEDDGYIKNALTGQKLGDLNMKSGRVQVRFLPTEDITIDLTGDWIERKGLSTTPTDIVGGSGHPNQGSYVNTLTGASVRPEYGDKTRDISFIGRLEWDLDWSTLEIIGGYRDSEQNLFFEFLPFSSGAFGFAPAAGLCYFCIDQDSDAEIFTIEAKLNGDTEIAGRRLDWIFGVFYSDENNGQLANDIGVAAGFPFDPTNVFDRTFDYDVMSLAGFAQFDYEIVPDVTVTVGARYTYEKKETVELTSVAGGFTVDDLALLGIPNELEEYQLNPKAGIDWQATDNALLYFSATNGFKSGGWNTRVNSAAAYTPFPSQNVWEYEVGAKTEWFDNRLRVNVAAYWAVFKDIQLTVLVDPAPIFGVGNGGEARARGVEVEIEAVPIEGLTLFVNSAYNEGSITKLSELVVSDTIIVGTPLKRLPQFQAQAGFNYTRPVYNYGDAFIGADVSWAGDYNITSDPYGRFQTGAIFERPDQALVSAQVGFETADDRVRVVAECSNCTDQQYFTNTLSGFFYPARGIDYGLRLELKY